MSDEQNNIEQAEEPVEKGPVKIDFGQQLKQAREAAGLTVIEVADELKLTEQLINDLEASDLERLPAATFAVGYLRNYARLLKLPEDEMAAAFNQLVPRQESSLTPISGVPAQKNSHDSLVKLTSYGLLVLVIFLVLLWWQQADFDWLKISAPETGGTVELDIPIADDSSAQNDTEIGVLDAAPEMEPATEDVVAEEQVRQAEPEVAASEPEVEASVEPQTPATRETVEVTPVAETTGEQLPTTPPLAGDDELVISTDSESWVEIRDPNGAKLLVRLISSGRDYRVVGAAPFRVFLGNAPSVSLQVNGEAVDISGFIRGNNTARVLINDQAVPTSR